MAKALPPPLYTGSGMEGALSAQTSLRMTHGEFYIPEGKLKEKIKHTCTQMNIHVHEHVSISVHSYLFSHSIELV